MEEISCIKNMSTEIESEAIGLLAEQSQQGLSENAALLKRKKRCTVQVRIERELQVQLKAEAKRWHMTLSRLMDKISKHYLTNFTSKDAR
jgi:hypothetical protein